MRRVATISAAIASEIGVVRQDNQDRAAIVRARDCTGSSFVVAALADGIGGLKDGAVCAATTLGVFIATIFEMAAHTSDAKKWILCGVKEANELIKQKYDGQGGSTLVAYIYSTRGFSYWVSVGDSRIYEYTASGIRQLSIDDTIAGQLGRDNDKHLEQTKLLQFIGFGKYLEPHIEQVSLHPESTVLLTTDGAHFIIGENPLVESILLNATDPGACAHRLVELSRWCGGIDNASVALMPSAPAIDSDFRGLRRFVWNAV